MNDLDYRAKELKRTAQGARHKNRRGKGRVSLPSDNMTNAEWKRRCGPVSTYTMTKPITWANFKKLPRDIQELYLTGLTETFGPVNGAMLSALFGTTGGNVSLYCRRHGLPHNSDRNLRVADQRAWERWLTTGELPGSAPEMAETTAVPEGPAGVDKPEDGDYYPEASTTPDTSIQSLSLNFTARSWDDVVKFLARQAIDSTAPLKVQFRVDVMDGDEA